TNDIDGYSDASIAKDTAVNAFGLIVLYQLGALRLARAWSGAAEAARPALARRILATEAFVLHFLEDAFSAGHVAGTWGGVASQKGTHDYYSTHGIDTRTWSGEPATVFGDAHLHTVDLERTAHAVTRSLSQVFEATREGSAFATAIDSSAAADASAWNSC